VRTSIVGIHGTLFHEQEFKKKFYPTRRSLRWWQRSTNAESEKQVGREDVPSPPDDPAQPPSEGWEWKGKGPPGSRDGSWYNPTTGESLNPDLGHGDSIGPHWDWKNPSGGS
jgi:hypothetical protein